MVSIPIEIINDLNGKFATMTEAEKAAYSATIFTSAGLKAFNSIAGNSADQLEELKTNLIDCNGAAEQMAKTKLDNLKGDITILTSARLSREITPYISSDLDWYGK